MSLASNIPTMYGQIYPAVSHPTVYYNPELHPYPSAPQLQHQPPQALSYHPQHPDASIQPYYEQQPGRMHSEQLYQEQMRMPQPPTYSNYAEPYSRHPVPLTQHVAARNTNVHANGNENAVLTNNAAFLNGPKFEKGPISARPRPQCWDHGCNGREFSTFSNLLRHQREKSGVVAKAECHICNAVFTRTTARNIHVAQGKCKGDNNADKFVH